MAINQAMCGSFKKEILAGVHRWTTSSRGDGSSISADNFYVAMFTSSRSDANEDLTGYTNTNEVSGTNYTAGGQVLGSVTIGLTDNSSSVPTAFLDFADTTFSSSTISNARVAVIYNHSLTNAGTAGTVTHAAKPSVAVLDFGSNKSSSSGDFTIQYPANDANNAVIRIA